VVLKAVTFNSGKGSTEGCSTVLAVLLAARGSPAHVAQLPTGQCRAARFSCASTQGRPVSI
jgi:hypothetical protein